MMALKESYFLAIRSTLGRSQLDIIRAECSAIAPAIRYLVSQRIFRAPIIDILSRGAKYRQ